MVGAITNEQEGTGMLDYIEIGGFKTLKKVNLKLEPLNILIGGNGSGKSNL